MRIIVSLLLILLNLPQMLAQQANNFWTIIPESRVALSPEAERVIIPQAYQTLSLDLDALKRTLLNAPMENVAGLPDMHISLPMPDGRVERFEVEEAPVMMPGLQAKFPHIRAYRVKGINGNKAAGRIDFSDRGFHASIITKDGFFYIDPYAKGQTDFYISYYLKDYISDARFDHSAAHAIAEEFNHIKEDHSHNFDLQDNSSSRAGEPVVLREYRFALTNTVEFAQVHGGTESGVMSAFNTATNRLNAIFEKELDARFKLIDNNDVLINVTSDNFANPSIGAGLLEQNANYLEATIGNDAFDIGHIFTGPCTDVGGVAVASSTCGINKARGATCHSSSVIEPVVTQIMAHEVGHQLAASHTWNFCPGSEDQRTSTTAFEPGGGSTIMSYAGLCGSENNVQFSSDEYYHVSSINQVFDFTREGDGSTCGTEIQTNNNTPDVTLPYEDGFYIPISTPFRLKAEGSDQDGDDITYCWEQYNSGPAAIMGMPTGNGASFRSFPPTENPERIFPTLNRIISNTNHVTEVLPTYTRNLKFRCTVRDDQFQNGGISWAEMSFEATASAGPFRVEFPNTMETLEVGSWQEITWDVANTDNDLVDCHFVNIRLSTDGGQTYPISLAENVPNDGAQFVTIPNAVTVDARVMIEAANNIFFDISNADSEIVLPADPTVFFSASPALQTVCLPDAVTIDIATEALQGFTGDISFAVNNLPDGAVPNFSANPTTPDAGTDLSIDMSQVTANGEFDVEIVLTGDNLTDPISRIVTLNIVNSDFSALALSAPANGETGVAELPDFSWSDLPNVDFVDIEIATNPSFEDGSIVETASNINLSTYTPSTILEKNTPYFWRIRPNNACGAGDWSIPFAFQTETLSCANFSNTDVINITAQGTPTVQSKINLASGGAISDVNITKIKGQHDLVKHLEVRLISPEQTSVVLFRDLCGNTTLFDVALDDSAPEELPCPPIGGDTYLPQEPLEAFNTENSQGEWTLEAEVIDEAGNGGAIQEWGLQICSSVSLNGPFIVNNETLAVKPNEGNPITSEFLLADDNDNSPEELTFTIVTAPVNGSLFLLGNKLEVGSTFRQATINANNLRYVNDINGNADSDAFTFTVSDGAGGWVGVPAFNIDIDDNATTGLNDPEIADRIQVFPNPTDKQLTVLFDEVAQGDLNLRLINVQGQLARELNYSQASNRIQVNISDLASGVYVLQLSFGQATVTKKVTIQH